MSSTQSPSALTDTAVAGIVHPGAVYRLDTFMAAVGWGRAALRRARRNGLRVVRDGRTVFVLGDEFIRYLNEKLVMPSPPNIS